MLASKDCTYMLNETKNKGIIIMLLGICGAIYGLYALTAKGFHISYLSGALGGLLLAFAGTGLLKKQE